jgi:hypothetical protein
VAIQDIGFTPKLILPSPASLTILPPRYTGSYTKDVDQAAVAVIAAQNLHILDALLADLDAMVEAVDQSAREAP